MLSVTESERKWLDDNGFENAEEYLDALQQCPLCLGFELRLRAMGPIKVCHACVETVEKRRDTQRRASNEFFRRTSKQGAGR